jgi:hypothetical protein
VREPPKLIIEVDEEDVDSKLDGGSARQAEAERLRRTGQGVSFTQTHKTSKQIVLGNRSLSPRGPDVESSMISGVSVGIRKDPNQEFFQMCLLSYKMNNQDSEVVMELNHRELYRKCTEQDKKQFFEFSDWIQREVKKLKFKHAFRENLKKQESKKQW